MSVTGGFAVGRRGGCPESEVGGSSTQTSAFNSAISTNSRSKTFLTTFWGRDAAGLNGPAVVREGPAGFWPEREVPVAAVARRSKLPRWPGILGVSGVERDLTYPRV